MMTGCCCCFFVCLFVVVFFTKHICVIETVYSNDDFMLLLERKLPTVEHPKSG